MCALGGNPGEHSAFEGLSGGPRVDFARSSATGSAKAVAISECGELLFAGVANTIRLYRINVTAPQDRGPPRGRHVPAGALGEALLSCLHTEGESLFSVPLGPADGHLAQQESPLAAVFFSPSEHVLGLTESRGLLAAYGTRRLSVYAIEGKGSTWGLVEAPAQVKEPVRLQQILLVKDTRRILAAEFFFLASAVQTAPSAAGTAAVTRAEGSEVSAAQTAPKRDAGSPCCRQACLLVVLSDGKGLQQRLLLLVAGGTAFSDLLLWLLPIDMAPTSEQPAAAHAASNTPLQLVQRLEGHRGGLFSLAFAEGGTILASASDDREIRLSRIWMVAFLDLLPGLRFPQLQPHALHQTRKHQSSGSAQCKGGLCEDAGGRGSCSCGELLLLQSATCSLLLLSAGEDSTVRIWSLRGPCLYTLEAHKGRGVRSLAVLGSALGASRLANRLGSSYSSGSAQRSEAVGGENDGTGGPWGLFATGGEDGCIKVWPVEALHSLWGALQRHVHSSSLELLRMLRRHPLDSQTLSGPGENGTLAAGVAAEEGTASAAATAQLANVFAAGVKRKMCRHSHPPQEPLHQQTNVPQEPRDEQALQQRRQKQQRRRPGDGQEHHLTSAAAAGGFEGCTWSCRVTPTAAVQAASRAVSADSGEETGKLVETTGPWEFSCVSDECLCLGGADGFLRLCHLRPLRLSIARMRQHCQQRQCSDDSQVRPAAAGALTATEAFSDARVSSAFVFSLGTLQNPSSLVAGVSSNTGNGNTLLLPLARCSKSSSSVWAEMRQARTTPVCPPHTGEDCLGGFAIAGDHTARTFEGHQILSTVFLVGDEHGTLHVLLLQVPAVRGGGAAEDRGLPLQRQQQEALEWDWPSSRVLAQQPLAELHPRRHVALLTCSNGFVFCCGGDGRILILRVSIGSSRSSISSVPDLWVPQQVVVEQLQAVKVSQIRTFVCLLPQDGPSACVAPWWGAYAATCAAPTSAVLLPPQQQQQDGFALLKQHVAVGVRGGDLVGFSFTQEAPLLQLPCGDSKRSFAVGRGRLGGLRLAFSKGEPQARCCVSYNSHNPGGDIHAISFLSPSVMCAAAEDNTLSLIACEAPPVAAALPPSRWSLTHSLSVFSITTRHHAAVRATAELHQWPHARPYPQAGGSLPRLLASAGAAQTLNLFQLLTAASTPASATKGVRAETEPPEASDAASQGPLELAHSASDAASVGILQLGTLCLEDRNAKGPSANARFTMVCGYVSMLQQQSQSNCDAYVLVGVSTARLLLVRFRLSVANDPPAVAAPALPARTESVNQEHGASRSRAVRALGGPQVVCSLSLNAVPLCCQLVRLPSHAEATQIRPPAAAPDAEASCSNRGFVVFGQTDGCVACAFLEQRDTPPLLLPVAAFPAHQRAVTAVCVEVLEQHPAAVAASPANSATESCRLLICTSGDDDAISLAIFAASRCASRFFLAPVAGAPRSAAQQNACLLDRQLEALWKTRGSPVHQGQRQEQQETEVFMLQRIASVQTGVAEVAALAACPLAEKDTPRGLQRGFNNATIRLGCAGASGGLEVFEFHYNRTQQ
ncbi:wd-repeat-containing protein [Cyclospora cayetanensis]|uniref:Wd-repeat-containing protein n=1 Tax=Cyclospora cayetanensis TaxID=88456 RepID=A0A1D3CVZ4_9EIME|nr:wd-repeat-containing protein [Cyclospora cayetanensis]